jgi:hypothetical protein
MNVERTGLWCCLTHWNWWRVSGTTDIPSISIVRWVLSLSINWRNVGQQEQNDESVQVPGRRDWNHLIFPSTRDDDGSVISDVLKTIPRFGAIPRDQKLRIEIKYSVNQFSQHCI